MRFKSNGNYPIALSSASPAEQLRVSDLQNGKYSYTAGNFRSPRENGGIISTQKWPSKRDNYFAEAKTAGNFATPFRQYNIIVVTGYALPELSRPAQPHGNSFLARTLWGGRGVVPIFVFQELGYLNYLTD